jgi:UDP-glucose 4-epimerase
VVNTNIQGSANVVRAAIDAKVKSVVCLSTDKAVYPINAMGMSKALMEKTALSFARNGQAGDTVIAVTRYGNVMASRGSVIPLFINQIKTGKPITVTEPQMTRFLMSLNESVDLVKYAFEHATSGDLFVRKAPASTVETLVQTAIDHEGYFQVPLDTRSLDYSLYFDEGAKRPAELEAYTSHNTTRLDVEGVKKLLLTLPEVQAQL